MSRAKKRADRLREAVPIQRYLADSGYPVDGSYEGEQQFPCNLHGDGIDNKPSARVYPVSKSWYCFSCDRTRDIIQTCREREGLGFWDAIRALERRYGLPTLVDDGSEEDNPAGAEHGVTAEVVTLMDPTPDQTFEDEATRTERYLTNMTKDKDLPPDALLRLWEAFDKVRYLSEKAEVSEETAKAAMVKIRVSAQKTLVRAFEEGNA